MSLDTKRSLSMLSLFSYTSLSSTPGHRTPEDPSNKISAYTVSTRRCRCSDKFTNYHSSRDYDDEPRRKRPENDVKPNNVLLFTVINPSYPITTDVLHTICKSSGNVVRIVVFKKNGVQAMIEFETQDEAKRAKESLNGADIYSGCCTLKIEYAKPTKLNVYKNDADSWDYTQPTLGMGNSRPARPGPLLPEPPRLLPTPPGPPNMQQNYNNNNSECCCSSYLLPSPPPDTPELFHSTIVYPSDDYFGSRPPLNRDDYFGSRAPSNFEFERNYNNTVLDKFLGKPSRGGMGGGSGGGPPSSRGFGMRSPNSMNASMGAQGGDHGGGSVLMVYELDPERVNPDKVFNLFCLYGNVAKIKFLKTKEGCCMIQMGDVVSAERAIANLSKTILANGKRLAVAMSKQVYLSDVLHPFPLPDGTDSFQDYSGSRKNRFMNMKMAMKNRIQGPTKLLHFFNAPPDITPEELSEVFTKAGVAEPIEINIFKPNRGGDSDKPASSSSGLIEFEELKDAVDAIMQCNHAAIDSDAGKYPFMLKLCFSSARSVNSTSRRNGGDFEEEID